MFEDEAEEYADKTRIKDENTSSLFPDERIVEVSDYEGNRLDITERIKKSFMDGAELGFNEGLKTAKKGAEEIIQDLLCLLEDFKDQIPFDEDKQKITNAMYFLM